MESSNSNILTSQKNNQTEGSYIPQNSQKSETSNIDYLNIYPPINEFSDNDLNTNVPNITWEFPQKNKDDIDSPNENMYDINEEFLESLLQRKNNLDKTKYINTMNYFIRNSKLIKKFEKEYTSDKKIDMENLILNCVKCLGFVKLEKGDILFKIGDIGDKFYFIINGKISILKLKELKNVLMTNVEYLRYCIFLSENKEDYLLNEVFKKNKKYFDITNIEDIIKIYRIIFIKLLREKIINHTIDNNEKLLKFFKEYKQEPTNFHVLESELAIYEEQKNKDVYGSTKDWENYVLKRVRASIKESIFFEEYEDLFKNKYKKYYITCYVYESFLFFGPGLFFGDFALDIENARRNATIRAEEKTYLGWMKSLDYANIIAPRRKIEKHNEIMFLYKNFFFKSVNIFVFEKKYFHLFPPREYFKGEKIHLQNSMPKGLIFIKNGQIQIDIKVSVFELQYIIEQVFERMIKNNFYKQVSKYKGPNYLMDLETLKKMKRFLKEPILENVKDKNSKFMEELNKKARYKLTIITQNELIGLEEIFLSIGYLTSGEVVSDKVACYELSETQLNTFLEEEKNLIILYTKYSVNKILALLDKLQNLRKNRIYSIKNKYDNINAEQEKKMELNIEIMDNNKINDNKVEKMETIGEKNETIVEDESNIINNQNKNIFGNKYPLTRDAIINMKKILQDKLHIKNNIKKDKFFYSYLKNKKRKTEIKNPKIFQKKSFSFFMDSKEDNKKNSGNNSNININKYIIPENKNIKENSVLIGNTCIEADKIKNEIKKYNFFKNTKYGDNIIHKSINLNSDNRSQIFELSQLRYPLSDRLEVINNNTNYNYMTIYKKTEGKKFKSTEKNKNMNGSTLNNFQNDFRETEKNYFLKRTKYFFGKVKKRNVGNNTTLTKSLSLSDNGKKISMINLSEEQLGEIPQKKIIRKKELLPGIIKEFDKKMKDKTLYSYIHKGKTYNSKIKIKSDKKDEEVFIQNLSNFLPRITQKKYTINKKL